MRYEDQWQESVSVISISGCILRLVQLSFVYSDLVGQCHLPMHKHLGQSGQFCYKEEKVLLHSRGRGDGEFPSRRLGKLYHSAFDILDPNTNGVLMIVVTSRAIFFSCDHIVIRIPATEKIFVAPIRETTELIQYS